MTKEKNPDLHSVDEEWLALYSAGSLSEARRLLIDCQAAIHTEIASRIDTMDAVGGAILESAPGETMSENFLSDVMGKIDRLNPNDEKISEPGGKTVAQGGKKWMLGPLFKFLQHQASPLKWKRVGMGIERASISHSGKEDLYLLKAPAGLKMPLHSHHGQEWALILQGGYHIGETGYGFGDLHQEDENCTHAPIIDEGEDCITLVAIDGGLKFTSPFMRLLKPFIRI